MAEPKEKDQEQKNTIGDKVIAAALAAYGIAPEHVYASRYDAPTKEAIIVTNGGTRVRFKDGDKPEKLGEIAITGINPAKRKVIAGKEKK